MNPNVTTLDDVRRALLDIVDTLSTVSTTLTTAISSTQTAITTAISSAQTAIQASITATFTAPNGLYYKGDTDRFIEVFLRDSTTGNGKLNLTHTDVPKVYWIVEGGSSVNEVSTDTGTLGSHTDGDFTELGYGWYQFCPPDDLFLAAKNVKLLFSGTGIIDKEVKITVVEWT